MTRLATELKLMALKHGYVDFRDALVRALYKASEDGSPIDNNYHSLAKLVDDYAIDEDDPTPCCSAHLNGLDPDLKCPDIAEND